MRRGGVVAPVLVAVLLVAGGGVFYLRDRSERAADAAATAAGERLADGWARRDLSGLSFAEPADGTSFIPAISGLGDSRVSVTNGPVTRTGDRATTQLAVTWTLPGDVPWSYDVDVVLDRRDNGWTIASPDGAASLWAPGLQVGQLLEVDQTAPTRGDLLDRSGHPLMPLGTVYPVQLDPARATPAVASALETLVGEKAGTLVARLAAAKRSGSLAPIPVITYRQGDFEQRQARLDALAGVVYPRTTQPLARSRTFGQPMLGSFGEVTAEIVQASDGRYVAGDRAGLSGLQRQYDGVLSGTPGVSVSTDTGAGLFDKPPVDGEDVELTVSPDIQQAAEKALAATGSVPSGLVAIDVESGDILASANSPALGFDRALTGQFPPGSAFKVATTYALLTGDSGVTPQTPVACPGTITVDGRRYKNFAGESAAGSPTFLQDFARSCNTAFISLADRVAAGDLKKSAAALGVGAGWGGALGVNDAFAGSVPNTNGATDEASAMIGQGRNLASPAALAVMAATVARGSYIQPALVTSPTPDGVDRTPRPIDPEAAATLRALMGAVVSQGSGVVLQGTPGGSVSGKSGTAEYGNADPPKTHAWFIGFQGDVAFAVIVEQGRSGGTVAAPIAKAFLTALAGS